MHAVSHQPPSEPESRAEATPSRPTGASAGGSSSTRTSRPIGPVARSRPDSRTRPGGKSWRRDHAEGPASLTLFLDRLTRLANDPLRPIGGFENERTTGLVAPNAARAPFPIERDRTLFGDARTDHEIEVEASGRPGEPPLARIRLAIVRWLADEGGIETHTPPSKLARFQSIRAAADPEATGR